MATICQRGSDSRSPLPLTASMEKVSEMRRVHTKRSTNLPINESRAKSRERDYITPDHHGIIVREHIGFSRDKTDSLPGYLQMSQKKRSLRRGPVQEHHHPHHHQQHQQHQHHHHHHHHHHGEIITQRRASTLTQGSHESDSSDKDKKLRTSHIKNLRRLQSKQLYEKFRRVAKLITFCARLAKSYDLRNKVYDEIAPYLNSLHFYNYDSPVEGVDLMFDPRKFKADKQLRLPEEAIRVLSKPCSDRTDKELYFAQLALRNNKAFSEYPVRMQRKIVEVGFYEKYEAKRVIVRQGYPAVSFYFILSGSVVVMVSENNTKVAKPVAYMSRGSAFGELAIINRTNRQATIVTKSTLELLSIDIESFHKIFMAGGVKNIHDPDHNDFMSSLSFLKGWPIALLSEEPTKYIFHYFKRGDIMVKDSNYSDWIFLVKSGSVQVLKKLKRVEPYEWLKKEEKLAKTAKTTRTKQGEKELRDKQRRFVLPEIKIPKKDADEVEDREVDLGRMTHTSSCEIDCVRNANSHAQPPSVVISNGTGNSVTDDPATNMATVNRECVSPNRPQSCSSTKLSRLPDRRGSSPTASSSVFPAVTTVTSVKTYNVVNERHRKGLKSSKTKGNKKKTKNNKLEHDGEEFEQEINRKQELRTITDDFDSKFRLKAHELTEADIDPQFVNVQTLIKGQVFGIAETLLGKQPSFCLVSGGAECIMIDKLFYLQNAPEDLLRNMRQECCPYPSDEDMQEELQTTIDWAAYKNSTFKNTLKHIGMKKSPRDAPL